MVICGGLCFIGLNAGFAQSALLSLDSLSVIYANRIDTSRIRIDLTTLSGDEFKGRETAEPGQKAAAAYLASVFKNIGLKPTNKRQGYIQTYPLFKSQFESGMTILDNDTLKVLEDCYTFTALTDTVLQFSDLVFLGYGISDEKYDNYRNKDMRGKSALIFGGEPMVNEISMISNSVLPTMWSDGYEAKLALAAERGVAALFVVQENFEKNLPRVTYYLQRPKLLLAKPGNQSLPVIFVSPESVSRIFPEYDRDLIYNALITGEQEFEISRSGNLSFQIKRRVDEVFAENLVGIVEGEKYPDEVVILSAHYDHLGIRNGEIYNGADDNGSGTSTLLELARIFAKAKADGNGTDRSMGFLLFSGEEKGLLGSEYYVENPLIPLKNTVVDLNVDMIGRTDYAYQDSAVDYIYVIGSDKLSSELHTLSEKVNERYTKLRFDYKFNDPDDPQRLYYRSDHYNFAKHKIPVIFYFRGLHDDYHKPTDTVEKIEFDTIDKVSRLIFHTAWEIANREERIRVDEELD